jgi:hypothetical protein
MVAHGENNVGTKFRYVWTRRKDTPDQKFHIGRRYEEKPLGQYAGKTIISCIHGPHLYSFKNDEMEFHEFDQFQNYFHSCYYCVGEKKDVQNTIKKYLKTIPDPVHGKTNGVAYRYVWAKPKMRNDLRYHIARSYEGDFAGGGPKLEGSTFFLCSHYGDRWRNEDLWILKWSKMPGYYSRCGLCDTQRAKYDGWIKKALEDNELSQPPTPAELQKEKKSDEEDIGVETKEDRTRKCLQNNVGMGRHNILPPYSECVKCKRRYAINVGTYIPLDGTGIRLRKYTDHANTGMLAELFLCVCDYPIVVRTSTSGAVWSKINVGKPVLK